LTTELHTILLSGGHEIPNGTLLEVSRGSESAAINLKVKFPGQKDYRTIENVAIKDGVALIAVKLLFFSYAKENRAEVREIADRLFQDGFLTWLDYKDLKPGDNWKTRIDDVIQRADYVLLFLSSTSVSKVGYVQRELKYALEQMQLRPTGRRYIIPIRLDNCDVPRELGEIQWLNLWQEGAYQKLIDAIEEQ